MSMISPDSYAEKLKNASIKTLIKERRELIAFLHQYEDDHILGNKKEREIVKPSPSTRYLMYNEYLRAITELIEKKRQQEYLNSFKR